MAPERISALSEAELDLLMRDLLRAQAYRSGADVSKVIINTEGKAKDGGADARTPPPASRDPWLGSEETCWQFKSGTAGQAGNIKKEIAKPIPRSVLEAGGRFVLVAPASTRGEEGEAARLKVLHATAKAAKIPAAKVEVIGSERLAEWCNQHPAIAARWAGHPDGLLCLDDWLENESHKIPWQATPNATQEFADRRRDLDFAVGPLRHLHIEGPSGVGKTRFALELCRNAPWRGAVIYFPWAKDSRIHELIEGAVAAPGVTLVAVIDGVNEEHLSALRSAVDRGMGRVRLITVGEVGSPDPLRIPSLVLKPLDRVPMSGIIRSWYPAMPLEHVDYVIRFADGYVGLARLVADIVMSEPELSLRALFERPHIGRFFEKLIGPNAPRSLHVLAALASVGWSDEHEEEGRAVSRHLELDWNDVRHQVDAVQRRLGIVPSAGRYRRVVPEVLGNYLAIEAWRVSPELMRSLPDALPTERARDAYFARLKAIASAPNARQFAEEQLRRMDLCAPGDALEDVTTIRRWSALSAADTALAARMMRDALEPMPIEGRRRIVDRAQRECVWTLTKLAWMPLAFFDATHALALLAESEGEGLSDGATSEFVGKFKLGLGGTAVPYLERLDVLDGLVASDRPGMLGLVVRALLQALGFQDTRTVREPASDELPQREWHPRTGSDYIQCIGVALTRLAALAKLGRPQLLPYFTRGADRLVLLFREAPFRRLAIEVFEALRTAYPADRETIRKSIASFLYRERQYGQPLPADASSEVEALHKALEDTSLRGRLVQHAGQRTGDLEERPELRSLADELLANRDVLAGEWAWLTSGDARCAWPLGVALALADPDGSLESWLPMLPDRGQDPHLLSGYVWTRRAERGTAWYDSWVLAQHRRDPADISLLFDMSVRCGVTPVMAPELVSVIRTVDVPQRLVAALEYGRWAEELPALDVLAVLEALFDRGHGTTAVAMLDVRLSGRPAEQGFWSEFALKLVTASALIRTYQMDNYHWKLLAARYLPGNEGPIAGAILSAHRFHERGHHWFVEYNDAKEILRDCIRTDPSAVWHELAPHLVGDEGAGFGVGFPDGLVDLLPRAEVLAWAAAEPTARCQALARLVGKDLSGDGTLAAEILGRYGDDKDVADAFLSHYRTGCWTGSASGRWREIIRE
ncbi:MAG: hypothetical protein Q8M76_03830, partial [Spirochaetaceae bacterium]|nr:hypothetical protein [Spirochaetaceae bacterium]